MLTVGCGGTGVEDGGLAAGSKRGTFNPKIMPFVFVEDMTSM